jgi:hypothetical protein
MTKKCLHLLTKAHHLMEAEEEYCVKDNIAQRRLISEEVRLLCIGVFFGLI